MFNADIADITQKNWSGGRVVRLVKIYALGAGESSGKAAMQNCFVINHVLQYPNP